MVQPFRVLKEKKTGQIEGCGNKNGKPKWVKPYEKEDADEIVKTR